LFIYLFYRADVRTVVTVDVVVMTVDVSALQIAAETTAVEIEAGTTDGMAGEGETAVHPEDAVDPETDSSRSSRRDLARRRETEDRPHYVLCLIFEHNFEGDVLWVKKWSGV
jgi:hypothetical protein